MGIRINTNLDALNAQRNLGITGGIYSTAVSRLSSGLRITRAADDAAGLSISEKLRAQNRGLLTAVKNAQDGISLIQTAEGALNETSAMLIRMRELAVQAANGTLSSDDANAVRLEIVQLRSEIDRIGDTTQFNGKSLLNGAFQVVTPDAKAATHFPDAALIASDAGTVFDDALSGGTFGTYRDVNVVGPGFNTETYTLTDKGGGVLEMGGLITIAGIEIQLFQTLQATALDQGESETFNFTVFGISFTFENVSAGTSTLSGALTAAEVAADMSGDTVEVELLTAAGGVGDVYDNALSGGEEVIYRNVQIAGPGPAIIGMNYTLSAAAAVVSMSGYITVAGSQYLVTQDLTAATIIGLGKTQTFDFTLFGIEFTVENVCGTLTPTLTGAQVATSIAGDQVDIKGTPLVTTNALVLQIGANAGQTAEIALDDSRSTAIGDTTSSGDYANLSEIVDALTRDNMQEMAGEVIEMVDFAITDIATSRSALGAYQNRLGHTVNNLNVGAENMQASESRIRDADIALETVDFIKAQILQQAGTAVLAQANQTPQTVLALLR